jgi:hypothetical protein
MLFVELSEVASELYPWVYCRSKIQMNPVVPISLDDPIIRSEN